MLDAITPGAAVFEPEQVDVLTAAFGLAIKKVSGDRRADERIRLQVARLVHNLGRSRLRLNKRLRDAADAATLAEEVADLAAYLRESTPPADDAVTKPIGPVRAVPIFPADARTPPPPSVLRSRGLPRAQALVDAPKHRHARRNRKNHEF